MLELHINVPGDKVLKSMKATGKCCPVLSIRVGTFSPRLENNDTLKCNSDNLYRNAYTCSIPGIFLELNCNVLFVLQSRGQAANYCWNFMNQGYENVTYITLLRLIRIASEKGSIKYFYLEPKFYKSDCL